MAASEAAKEAVWLMKFILDLHVIPSADRPITLYCDNSGAVAQSKEPRFQKRQKHILRKYHLIRDFIDRGDTVVTKIASEENCNTRNFWCVSIGLFDLFIFLILIM